MLMAILRPAPLDATACTSGPIYAFNFAHSKAGRARTYLIAKRECATWSASSVAVSESMWQPFCGSFIERFAPYNLSPAIRPSYGSRK